MTWNTKWFYVVGSYRITLKQFFKSLKRECSFDVRHSPDEPWLAESNSDTPTPLTICILLGIIHQQQLTMHDTWSFKMLRCYFLFPPCKIMCAIMISAHVALSTSKLCWHSGLDAYWWAEGRVYLDLLTCWSVYKQITAETFHAISPWPRTFSFMFKKKEKKKKKKRSRYTGRAILKAYGNWFHAWGWINSVPISTKGSTLSCLKG